MPSQTDVRYHAGPSTGVPEKGRLVVDASDRTIGIFRIDGKLYAYENRCPHQGGPVCQGMVTPGVVELLDEGLVERVQPSGR